MIDIESSNSCYPSIDKPTLITKSSTTLIDNILSNNLLSFHDTGLLYGDVSDHLHVFTISKLNVANVKSSKVNIGHRIINQRNIEALIRNLHEVDWRDVYAAEDPNDSYFYIFQNKFRALYDKHFPIVFEKKQKKEIKMLDDE